MERLHYPLSILLGGQVHRRRKVAGSILAGRDGLGSPAEQFTETADFTGTYRYLLITSESIQETG